MGIFTDFIKKDRYVFRRMGRLGVHMIAEPSVIRSILDEPDVFPKPVYIQKIIDRNVGKGLLSDHGPSWEPTRKHLAERLSPRAVNALFSNVIIEESERLAQSWLEAGTGIHAERDIGRMAARIAGKVVLGETPDDAAAQTLEQSVGILLKPSKPGRLLSICKILGLPFNPVGRRSAEEQKARDAIDAIVYPRILGAHAESSENGVPSILGHLLSYTDPQTGKKLDDSGIHGQVLTFLAAGQDTTSSGLTFTFRELALNPDVAGKVRAEVEQTTGGGSLRSDHIRTLSYTRNVFLEGLRCHAPVYALAREAMADRTYDSIKIRKGHLVTLFIEAVNNDKTIWHEPERFNPDRFKDNRDFRNLFLPFGGGKRICAGQSLAMNEGVAAIAQVCRAMDLSLEKDIENKVRSFTMRPVGDLVLGARVPG